MNETPEKDGMIRVEKPSALPFWAAAAIWVSWALFLPMYMWYHYLICGAVSAAVWFVVSRLAPAVVVWEKAPIDTGDPKLDAVLREIGAVKDALAGAESGADDGVRSAIGRIRDALDGISAELCRDPKDMDNARRFMNYYLPTIQKLAEKYQLFIGTPGDTAAKTVREIGDAFGMIASAMEKFRDSLYEGDALDISTDIDVLETMLKQDGLD